MVKDRKTVTIWILAVLLAIALIYMGCSMYQNRQLVKQNAAANYGYQVGYGTAVSSLMQEAATCQAVPVTLGNQTMNLVAVECLQTTQK